MVVHDEQSHSKKDSARHLIKKCPNCFEYLSLNAKVCPACQTKIGEVNKLGFAQKPFDWLGYLLAAVAVVGFVVYMWWAFFRD